MVNFCWE